MFWISGIGPLRMLEGQETAFLRPDVGLGYMLGEQEKAFWRLDIGSSCRMLAVPGKRFLRPGIGGSCYMLVGQESVPLICGHW